ncbi:MAG TPA: hypothetical protein DDW52_21335 [Planctomycetaceae bacterium]|nr:hypothetical protein [Planctomycetaceae bacterium]
MSHRIPAQGGCISNRAQYPESPRTAAGPLRAWKVGATTGIGQCHQPPPQYDKLNPMREVIVSGKSQGLVLWTPQTTLLLRPSYLLPI